MTGNTNAQKHGVYAHGEAEAALNQLRAELLAGLLSKPRQPVTGQSVDAWIAEIDAAACTLDPVERGRVDRLIESERRSRLLAWDARQRGVLSVRGAVLAAARFAQQEAALWDRLAARMSAQPTSTRPLDLASWLAAADEVQTSTHDDGDDE